MGWRSIVPIDYPTFNSYEQLLTYLHHEYSDIFELEIEKSQNQLHFRKTS